MTAIILQQKITRLEKTIREKDQEITNLKVQIDQLSKHKIAKAGDISPKGSIHDDTASLRSTIGGESMNNNSVLANSKEIDYWKKQAKLFKHNWDDAESRVESANQEKLSIVKDHDHYQEEVAKLRNMVQRFEIQMNEKSEECRKLTELADKIEKERIELFHKNQMSEQHISQMETDMAALTTQNENDSFTAFVFRTLHCDLNDVFTKAFQNLTSDQRNDGAKALATLFHFDGSQEEYESFSLAGEVFNEMIAASFPTSFEVFEMKMSQTHYADDVIHFMWQGVILEALKIKLGREHQRQKIIPRVPMMRRHVPVDASCPILVSDNERLNQSNENNHPPKSILRKHAQNVPNASGQTPMLSGQKPTTSGQKAPEFNEIYTVEDD